MESKALKGPAQQTLGSTYRITKIFLKLPKDEIRKLQVIVSNNNFIKIWESELSHWKMDPFEVSFFKHAPPTLSLKRLGWKTFIIPNAF